MLQIKQNVTHTVFCTLNRDTHHIVNSLPHATFEQPSTNAFVGFVSSSASSTKPSALLALFPGKPRHYHLFDSANHVTPG